MTVRTTMSQIISRVRLLIGDQQSPTQFFADQDIQDTCDERIDFIRYEPLTIAPTIINTASTGNQASVIFVEYFSAFKWWEADAVVQGVNIPTSAAWVVLTPTQSDYINGHFWFESPSLEFTAPTVPGQYPPVFCTGKVYDIYGAASDLLEFWAASLLGSYDITVDGQSLHRSQMSQMKQKQADIYKRKAKPKMAQIVRTDVNPETNARRMRLLDAMDTVR